MKGICKILFLFFFCAGIFKVYSADQVVTNNNDSGAGSLRQAISDVHDGGTITFDDNYTITLGSSLSVSKSLTITGNGAGNTIIQAAATAGTATYRVIQITSGTVILQEMTLRHGKTATGGTTNYGACIQINGSSTDVTIKNCYITDNQTGSNGGAIDVFQSTINILNSTLSGNSGFHGGAVYTDDATVVVSNSTFYNNTSDNSGSCYGGGLYLKNSSNTIKFSTICENSCGQSTGGGLDIDGGTLSIQNSIIANNLANGSAQDFENYNGTVTDNGYNIVEITTGFTWNASGDITGNQANLFGTAKATQILADNGGSTETLALESGSVAIDAGAWDASLTTDQRNFLRENPPCIGAYEFGGVTPVEMVSFSYRHTGEKIFLEWQTATEIENYGFEIHKAVAEKNEFTEINTKDLTGWKKIGFVEGHGNSNSPKFYSFSDNDPQKGRLYYRLKQIDNDGGFEYSEILSVLNSTGVPDNFVLLQNYPNPFNPTTNISFLLPTSSDISIRIYDINGNLIDILKEERLDAGSYQIEWNGKNFASGVYFYTVASENISKTKKMILLR